MMTDANFRRLDSSVHLHCKQFVRAERRLYERARRLLLDDRRHVADDDDDADDDGQLVPDLDGRKAGQLTRRSRRKSSLLLAPSHPGSVGQPRNRLVSRACYFQAGLCEFGQRLTV